MKKISKKTYIIGALTIGIVLTVFINFDIISTKAEGLDVKIWTKQPQLNDCGICETLRAPTSVTFQLLAGENTGADQSSPTTFWWSCDGDDNYEGGPSVAPNFMKQGDPLYYQGEKVVEVANTFDQQFRLYGNQGWSYGNGSNASGWQVLSSWSEQSANYNPQRWAGINATCGYSKGGTYTMRMKAERNGIQNETSRTFSLANQASNFVPEIGFPESRYLQFGMDLRNYETENGAGYKPPGMATPAKVHLALSMRRASGQQPAPYKHYSVPGSDRIEPFEYRIECGNGQVRTGSKWQWGEDAPIYQSSTLSRAVLATNACTYTKAGEYSLSVYFTGNDGISVDHDGNGTPLKTFTNIKVSASGPAKITLSPNPGQTKIDKAKGKTEGTVYFNAEVSNLTPFGSGQYTIKTTCDAIGAPNVMKTEGGDRNEYKDTSGILKRSISGCSYTKPGVYRVKVEFTGNPHSEQWMGQEKGEASTYVYVGGIPEPENTSPPKETGPNERTITRTYKIPGGPIMFYLDWASNSSDENITCEAKDFQRVTQREYPEGYNELGDWVGELNAGSESLATFRKEVKAQLAKLSGKSNPIELKPGFYEYWLECEGNGDKTIQVDQITIGGRYWSAVVVGVNSTQNTVVIVDGEIVESFTNGIDIINADPRIKGIKAAKEYLPHFDPAIRENISYAELDELIEYMNTQYGESE